MIDRVREGKADAKRHWGTIPFTLAAITIAAMVLALAAGCAVLGNPSPCDRSQAMRNVLEEAIGRDCDLITDDDLAGVRVLYFRMTEVTNLRRADFGGLDIPTLYLRGAKEGLPAALENLEEIGRPYSIQLDSDREWTVDASVFAGASHLAGLHLTRGESRTRNPRGIGVTGLTPSAFDGLDNLQQLSLSRNNLSDLPTGVFDGLGNLQMLDLSFNNLNDLAPGVFGGLTNLQRLDLAYNPGDPFRITHPNSDLQGRGWKH